MDFTNKVESPKLKHKTLLTIASVCTKAEFLGPVLKIIEGMAPTSATRLRSHQNQRLVAVTLQMLTKIYTNIPKVFPYVRSKIEAVVNEQSSSRELKRQAALSIKTICKTRGSDGVELIALISDMITNDDDEIIVSVGLDCLIELCLVDEVLYRLNPIPLRNNRLHTTLL
jgi:hypothetical protein